MKSRRNSALLIGCAAVALSARAPAQNASPPAPPYDPQQLPAEHGQLQQFTLTPRGDIDGMILTDGTEVNTPPHLSTEIAYSIKPGDTLIIRGLHAAALPLVQAVSISDEATGRTVIDDGPPPPRGRSAAPGWCLPRCTAAYVWLCMASAARLTARCWKTGQSCACRRPRPSASRRCFSPVGRWLRREANLQTRSARSSRQASSVPRETN